MMKGESGDVTNSPDIGNINNSTSITGTSINNTTGTATPTNTTPTSSIAPNGSESAVPPLEEKAVKAAEWFYNLLLTWGFPAWIARIALTILVLLITWYASRLISQMMGRRIARRFQRPSVSRTVLRTLRGSVIGIGVFFVLTNIYGVPISNIALSITVISATVGVVLAPLVRSTISGVFVLADQPYQVGDMIELVETGQQGYVEDITIRYTKLFTIDNTLLVIPNGSMRDRDVINYSGEDNRTRLYLDIGVTYDSDIDEARRLIEDAAREVDIIIEGGPDIRIGSTRYPAKPTCYIDQFGASSVQLRLRYWVKETTPYSLLAIRSTIQENVLEQFNESDVELSSPRLHVSFDDTNREMNVSMEQKTTNTNRERPSHPTGTQPRIDD